MPAGLLGGEHRVHQAAVAAACRLGNAQQRDSLLDQDLPQRLVEAERLGGADARSGGVLAEYALERLLEHLLVFG